MRGRSLTPRTGDAFADARPRDVSGSESSTAAFVFGGRPRRFGAALEAGDSSRASSPAGSDLRGRPRGRFTGAEAEAEGVPAGAGVMDLRLLALPARLALSSASTSIWSSSPAFALGCSFFFGRPRPFSLGLPTISSTPLSDAPSLASSSVDASLYVGRARLRELEARGRRERMP